MSARDRCSVFGGRKNPKTGELEIYEMTPEEAKEAINRIIESLQGEKLVQPKTVDREAIRGARHARRFLAANPTQEEIERMWEWTWDETAVNDAPQSRAYDEAYRKVLRRHLS